LPAAYTAELNWVWNAASDAMLIIPPTVLCHGRCEEMGQRHERSYVDLYLRFFLRQRMGQEWPVSPKPALFTSRSTARPRRTISVCKSKAPLG